MIPEMTSDVPDSFDPVDLELNYSKLIVSVRVLITLHVDVSIIFIAIFHFFTLTKRYRLKKH